MSLQKHEEKISHVLFKGWKQGKEDKVNVWRVDIERLLKLNRRGIMDGTGPLFEL